MEIVEKILENRPAMIVICIGVAIGAVASIAAGFMITYNVITYVGT